MVGVINQRYRVGKMRFVPSMGEAYDAFDLDRDKQRPVTIWLLPKIRPSLVEIFFEEHKKASSVNKNLTPQILDQGIDIKTGKAFIVFERIDVQTLESLLEDEKKLSQNIALKLFVHLLQALVIFHEANIIHGRLSPMNVLRIKSSKKSAPAKVIGFGLSYIQKTTSLPPLLLPYLAPEQLTGTIETESTDLYAAGMILYRSLVGESLLQSTEDFIESTGIDPTLGPIIRKLLTHNSSKRYLQSKDVLSDLKKQGLI